MDGIAMTDPRRAIVDRREQIAAEPRPTRLSPTDLGQEVAQARDADDVYRVYRPEWVIVYVASSADRAGDTRSLTEQINDHFDKKYDGRVRLDDVRFTVFGHGADTMVRLELRLPNLKGEFKTKDLARQYVTRHGWDDCTIVSRNSRDDHELRAYGVRKLPAT